MKHTLKGFVKRTKEKETPQKDAVSKETMRFIGQYFLQKKQTWIQFLTLPSAWWRFEIQVQQVICGTYGSAFEPPPYIRFIGCEREWTLFQLGCVYMPTDKFGRPLKSKRNEELNCSMVTNSNNYLLYHSDIFEFMRLAKSMKEEDDHRMDVIWLDMTVAITHIDDKLKHLANVVKSGSMVILTIVKAREHRKIPMERLDYINSLMEPMGLELVKKFEYRDSTPMLQLIYVKS